MKNFVTKKQFGQLLLGWLVIMAVLFLWELAERGGLLHIIGLGRLLRPLCAVLFAVWLARRHTREMASIKQKSIWIYGLLCVICFLILTFVNEGYFLRQITYSLSRIMGIDNDSVFFAPNGIPKEPRHLFYWFLCICYIDYNPLLSLLVEFGVYGVVKTICIKHNQKKGEVSPIAEQIN